MRQLQTEDGNVLLLNLHLSSRRVPPPIYFPSGEDGLPDQYARLLFQMSSQLPPYMKQEAQRSGYVVGEATRGFVFQAGIEDMISFLEIGTRPSNMR